MAQLNPLLGTDAQFRLFVDTVEEYAIFMTTPEGKVATWNAGVGRILGYEESEFVGRDASIIFTPEDVARGLPETEMRAAAAAGHAENERWHVRKDGSRFWGLGILTAIRDPQAGLVGFAKIMRDRTDLKELQETLRNRAEALASSDDRKSVFLATLSHELRNHLSGVVSATHILKLKLSGDHDLVQPLAILERQTGQLRRLVDDLLDISRIGAGKVELRKERVELAAVLRQAVETVHPLVDSRRHQLSVEAPPTPVWLEADPARLQQVFVNLLSNACKYTDEGGHVWLNATVEDHEAVVRVRDDGIGISADVLPLLFDLFTQDEVALGRAQGGLGIGLW